MGRAENRERRSKTAETEVFVDGFSSEELVFDESGDNEESVKLVEELYGVAAAQEAKKVGAGGLPCRVLWDRGGKEEVSGIGSGVESRAEEELGQSHLIADGFAAILLVYELRKELEGTTDGEDGISFAHFHISRVARNMDIPASLDGMNSFMENAYIPHLEIVHDVCDVLP